MGFSMGGYVAAAFAAAHPELLAGVLLGACCHDAHTLTWQLVGRMAEVVYKVCSDRTKAQVGGRASGLHCWPQAGRHSLQQALSSSKGAGRITASVRS